MALKQRNASSPAHPSRFETQYTRTSDGLYVRNGKPPSGTIDTKRIAENFRSLLTSDEDEKKSGS